MTQEPFILDDEIFFVINAEMILKRDKPLEKDSDVGYHDLREGPQRDAVIREWEKVHGVPWQHLEKLRLLRKVAPTLIKD